MARNRKLNDLDVHGWLLTDIGEKLGSRELMSDIRSMLEDIELLELLREDQQFKLNDRMKIAEAITLSRQEATTLAKQLKKELKTQGIKTPLKRYKPEKILDVILQDRKIKRTHSEIDAEYNLRKTQMHKFMHRGAPTKKAEFRSDRAELDASTDPNYVWDSSLRKEHQPAFRAKCYKRTVNGKFVFIPNVRIMMDPHSDMPLALSSRLWRPAEKRVHINVPVKERAGGYLPIPEKIQDIHQVWGSYDAAKYKAAPNEEGTHSNLDNKTQLSNSPPRIVSKLAIFKRGPEVLRKIPMTRNKVIGTLNGRPQFQYRTIEILESGGIAFKGSKEIGPPYCHKDGRITDWVCYADKTQDKGIRYTVLGKWASDMRRAFLQKLHDGEVEICKCVEEVNGKRRTKHQAYYVFTNLKISKQMPDGRVMIFTTGICLFCDIMPVSNSRFIESEKDRFTGTSGIWIS